MENIWKGGLFSVLAKLALLVFAAVVVINAAWILLLLIIRAWAYIGLPAALITGFLLYRVRGFQVFVSKHLTFLRSAPITNPAPIAITAVVLMSITSFFSIRYMNTTDREKAALQITPTAAPQKVAFVFPTDTPEYVPPTKLPTLAPPTPILVPIALPTLTELSPTVALSATSKPVVVTSGWSPEVACAFLANFPRMIPSDYELVTGLDSLYSCDTDGAKLPGMANTWISYSAIGNETLVSDLTLELHIYDAQPSQVTTALKLFRQYVAQVTQKATGKKLPAEWQTAIAKAVSRESSLGKYQLELRRDDAIDGKGYQLIFWLAGTDAESGNISSPTVSAKPITPKPTIAPTVDETVLYRPLAGNVWSGVKVYYGKVDDGKKVYGFEVIGGGSNCANMPSGKGVKVRYENGSEEWKDRHYLILSDLFFVLNDDPARLKMDYIDFPGCN